MEIEEFFDEKTMSVHLKENNSPFAKKGTPGKWTFEAIRNKPLSQEDIKRIAKNITESEDSVIEIDRAGSTIIQKKNIRVVIVKPPFSDGWEITAVRPVKLLDLKDYNLPSKLLERLTLNAEGILVAGSPGQGKTTFARALALFYANKNKIVKTIEAPRDLILPDSITQLAISYGSPEEIQDILLLSRPDYTIFDEMRNAKDFHLFSDLRLSGVGMVGIVHATNPIDAIQRFIGKIDLGIIPQVIDTVIFIKGGRINKTFEVKITVKTPSGMIEDGLARPVVTVNDFETGKSEFEIYSYGEETVVIPVDYNSQDKSVLKELIEKKLRQVSKDISVEMKDNFYVAYIPEGVILDDEILNKIENETGATIKKEKIPKNYKTINFEIKSENRHILLQPSEEVQEKEVSIYAGNDFIISAKISKKNLLKINTDSEQGKKIIIAMTSGKKIEMRA